MVRPDSSIELLAWGCAGGEHLLCHEAYHIGKLSLLRKLRGLSTISQLFFGG